MSIQRRDKDFQIPDPEGEFVTYTDHVAAVAAARAEEAAKWDCIWTQMENHFESGYEDGQRDERARIRAAVEARLRIEFDGHQVWSVDDGEAQPRYGGYVSRDAVLAVIDASGDSDE